MNERLQAILYRIVVELKKKRWTTGTDWNLTLKAEGHLPLVKYVLCQGNLDSEDFTDHVEVTMDLKLDTDDKVTYFPECVIHSQIYTDGAPTKDIEYKMEVDVGFIDSDYKDDKKAKIAADRLNSWTENYIRDEFSDYYDQNAEAITSYKAGGYRADQDYER